MSADNTLIVEFLTKDNLFNLVFFVSISFLGTIIGESLRTMTKRGTSSTLVRSMGNVFIGTLIATIISYSFGDTILVKYGMKMLFGFTALCGAVSLNLGSAIVQLDFRSIIISKLGGVADESSKDK